MDIQIIGWGKIFALYVSDQVILSKMYKEQKKKNRNSI